MNKKMIKTLGKQFVIAFMLVVAYSAGMYVARTAVEIEQAERVEPVQLFDVSALEEWGGCGADGTVRMVSATFWEATENSTILIDETGHLWEMENQFFNEWDFVLLWIGDCHTPSVEDDCVVKVWVEHYEVLG